MDLSTVLALHYNVFDNFTTSCRPTVISFTTHKAIRYNVLLVNMINHEKFCTKETMYFWDLTTETQSYLTGCNPNILTKHFKK